MLSMRYTLDELAQRHSVRSYMRIPLDAKIVNALKALATWVNSHEAGLNFQLFFDSGAPFEGFTRSYGMFSGVDNYLAAVIDPTFANAAERAGFYAEMFVMKCVSLSLGTCFVSGTFSASHADAQIEVYEKIPFVVPFGVASLKKSLVASITEKLAHRKSLKPRDFFEGSDEEYTEACKRFPMLELGLKGVALAPSAMNKQPVRFRMEKDDAGNYALTAHSLDPKSNAVDLGIAKFNFAAAAGGTWDWGENAPYLPD